MATAAFLCTIFKITETLVNSTGFMCAIGSILSPWEQSSFSRVALLFAYFDLWFAFIALAVFAIRVIRWVQSFPPILPIEGDPGSTSLDVDIPSVYLSITGSIAAVYYISIWLLFWTCYERDGCLLTAMQLRYMSDLVVFVLIALVCVIACLILYCNNYTCKMGTWDVRLKFKNPK